MSSYFQTTPRPHFAEGGWGGTLFPPHVRRGLGGNCFPRTSVDPPITAAPLLVAKHELLDLPGRGLGQLAELDGLGHLEARQPRPAVDDQLLDGELLA